MPADDDVATDPCAFAERLLGRPLWPHQAELARSPARYRIVVAGRQAGKSTCLAVIALHEAATRRDILVLLVSAGEVASKRLLDECSVLAARSDLLRGSVLDESKSQLLLSNGSRILSVPASQRQIRGWAVDLLIVDEAAFVDEAVWSAAEPAIVAKAGSRVILTSTPFGVDHFFRRLWNRGMTSPDALYESWHWPSSISPLMDSGLLEEIRLRESLMYFEREYLAEWTDGAGQYFTFAELEQATVNGAVLLPPPTVVQVPSVAGVDWGFARDASTLAVLAAADPPAADDGRPRYAVAWLLEHFAMRYTDFIDKVVAVASPYGERGYAIQRVISECNGVGAMPSQELQARMAGAQRGAVVEPVHTTSALKEDVFGFVKLLLQQGRLDLPRHPGLLKQLASLEYSLTEAGTVHIAVPERAGHDDLAMALGLATIPLMREDGWLSGRGPLAPLRPQPLPYPFGPADPWQLDLLAIPNG